MENSTQAIAKRNTQTIIDGKIITIREGDKFEFFNDCIVLKHNGKELGTFKKSYIEELRTELSI